MLASELVEWEGLQLTAAVAGPLQTQPVLPTSDVLAWTFDKIFFFFPKSLQLKTAARQFIE